jgi:S1-C subfamily serine protease
LLAAAAPAVPAALPVAAPVEGHDPLAALEAAQQRLFAELAPSVVFISNKEGFGSGFLVSRDGLVLTNAHVVGTAATVDVVMNDGRRHTGTVLEKHKSIDLALVQLPIATSAPLTFADGEALRVGAWIGAIGHGRGGIWTYNTGMVSNIYPIESGRPVFQTQIPLNPGASGGPIFDRRGRVVGVVTAALKDADSINFGINIAVALKELKQLGARCECLVVSAPDKTPVFIDGVMRGLGPRVVVPATPGAHEVVAVVKNQRRKLVVEFPAQRVVTLTADP